MAIPEHARQAPRIKRPTLASILLSLVVAGITLAAITHNYQHKRDTEVARLQAIALLKAQQIADWLQERAGDARLVQHTYQHAIHLPPGFNASDVAKLEQLERQLKIGQQGHNRGFDAAQLFTAAGVSLWRGASAPPVIAPSLKAAIHQASLDRQVHRVGPYRGNRGTPRIDYVIPSDLAGHDALIVLHIDTSDWLYTTLQDWPIPTRSGETLLFRRDGDQVRFLNELRHRQGTALQFNIPLAADLLASQVARGEAKPGRLVIGKDYRGITSLGVAQAIPGTDWFLMAKIDQSELYAEAQRTAIWIGLIGLLALFMALAGLSLFRQRQQLALAEGVQQAQSERLRALRLLAAIAESSNDAIVAKDLEGHYILFNPAASDIVGKPIDEVIGQDDRELFPAEESEQLMATHRRVVEENRVITQEDRLHTASGMRVFLATRGPLRDRDGKVIGTFGISRDITERKVSEQALQDSTTTMRAMTQAAQDAILMMDEQGRITFWNAAAEKIFGHAEHEALGKALHGLIVPTRYREAFEQGFRQFAVNGSGAVFGKTIEVVGLRKGGEEFPVELSISPLALKGQWCAVGILRDITERKHVEERARQQAVDLQGRYEELERFNRAMIGRELDMIALKRQVNELSQRLGDEPPYPLAFLDADAGPTPGDGTP